MMKPMFPEKQRCLPKIKQNSPLKLKDDNLLSSPERRTRESTNEAVESSELESKSSLLESAASLLSLRDDAIDVKMRDMQRSQAQDLRSDPTRKKLNRNYKQMLDIEVLAQKTIHDEQIEIRQ